MGLTRHLCALALLVVVAAEIAATAHAVGLAETEDNAVLDALVRPPPIATAALSSDGNYIAAVMRRGENTNLEVWPTASQTAGGPPLPVDGTALDWIAWVGGGRLVVSATYSPHEPAELYVYEAAAKTWRPLIAEGRPVPLLLPPVLLAALPDDPTAVLMQWEDPTVVGYPAVYRVNPGTGDAAKVVSAWKPVIRWYASPEGTIALGAAIADTEHALYHPDTSGGWRRFFSRDWFDDPALVPLFVEKGGQTALVLSAHASDTRALWRMNLTDGDFLRRLAGDERFDIRSAIVDPARDLVVGASLTVERPESRVWQADWAARERAVAAAFDAASARLVSAAREGTTQLFRVTPRVGPDRFALWREADLGPALIDDGLPRALPGSLKREMIWVPLRGGARMHAVLTHPPGGPTGRAVVKIHGGPIRRVDARHNALAAWMAHLGYSVLEPNFRGSAGYGERWRQLGYAGWGTVMQEDIADAAAWLNAEGVVAEGQLCAVGGSYGGYAALMAVVRDADLFRCAASMNGVTSLPLRLDTVSKRRFSALSRPLIEGRLGMRALRARSPLNRANLVRRPVLLAYGTEDDNVRPEHSVLMHQALVKARKAVTLLPLEGAGHALIRESEKRRYYLALRDFLATHIK